MVLELLSVDRSHGTIWSWTHTAPEAQSDPATADPSQVAVDEKQIEVDGENKWLYVPVATESKLLLEIDVFSHPRTYPAATFLQYLIENQVIDETEFLVDGGSYLTALARHELTGQFNYSERYYAEKMVSDFLNADQPLSFLLAGQSSQRMQLAQTVQTPLQLRSTESSAR